MKYLCRWLLTCLMFGSALAASAPSTEDSVRQLWQLLDYVAVDYAGAVANGAVIKESEYAEMREFSATALARLQELPAAGGRDTLLAQAEALKSAVADKASPQQVSSLAHGLADALIALYPIPTAPAKPPDLARGAALFAQQCASCHGAHGGGDGPLAARLDPHPIAFTDSRRASERSVLALYQAVSQGVSGTSMPAFKDLSDADRWALAFYAGTLSHDAAMRQRGAEQWRNEAALRSRFDSLAALTRSSETELAASVGADTARDVTAYLRSKPAAVTAQQPTGVGLARRLLRESLAAYRGGDQAGAKRLALSAYLDGFEPLEATLAARNKPLLTEVEKAMLGYRAAIASNQPERVSATAQTIESLLTRTDDELETANADPATAFVGALTILLREGIEALLVVVGMIAFLKKAGRPDVLRHVHAGWIGALVAGGLTWLAATYAVSISGASREVTEGASSLFAAIVLLGVGLWMHRKSSAGRWQAYLRDKMSAAMTRRSAYAMALLAFVAVYREVFESVLFFSALWTEGNGVALLAGLAAGAGILGGLAWALLRTSARMPIGKFFFASSILVAVLAVVLAGKGIKALQEAGIFDVHPIAFPRIEVLGVYPTSETLVVQLVIGAIALLGFWLNSRLRAPGTIRT